MAYVKTIKKFSNLAEFAGKGKIQFCYAGQCPPPTNHGFVTQFYPGLPELQQYGESEKQEAAAANINMSIKQEMQATLAKVEQLRDEENAKEIRAIMEEMKILDDWVRATNAPFKDAPLLPAYRRAEELVKDLGYGTPTISPEEIGRASCRERV